jgi:fumarate reductase subunit C
MIKQRYQTPMGPLWFLKRAGYRRFMAREMTAFAMAAFLVYLLYWLHAIGDGYTAFVRMVEFTRNPVTVTLLGLAFGALLYHSITWFNLTPKIMPMYVAEEKVPDVWAAIIMGYLPCAALTAVILWSVMRTG